MVRKRLIVVLTFNNGILFRTEPPDILAPNAHFTHYAALSAAGFNHIATTFQEKVLTTLEVAGNSAKSLVGKILFTIGWHAGLNVPEKSSVAADPATTTKFPNGSHSQRT